MERERMKRIERSEKGKRMKRMGFESLKLKEEEGNAGEGVAAAAGGDGNGEDGFSIFPCRNTERRLSYRLHTLTQACLLSSLLLRLLLLITDTCHHLPTCDGINYFISSDFKNAYFYLSFKNILTI